MKQTKQRAKIASRRIYKPIKRTEIVYGVKPHTYYRPKRQNKALKIREAERIPHTRTFVHTPRHITPQVPFRYKHKAEYVLNFRFVALLLLTLAAIGGLVYFIIWLLNTY